MRKLFSSLLLLLILPALFAQTPDTISLDEVSVAAMPFRKNYDEYTGAVAHISLRQEGLLHVVNNEEVLNRLPGVFMAAGTHGTNRLVIRGVGSRTPYGTNRVRAYLDGIPLTNGDGVTTLEDVDVFGLASMEVVKGPSSALYGSGLGGVVLLNSAYPSRKGWSIEQGNELGSFGSFRNRILLGHKGEKLSWKAGYNRTATEGYRDNSAYKRHNAFVNGKRYGKRSELSVHLHLTDVYGEIPSSLNEEDFSTAPWKAAGNWLATEGYEDYVKLLGGLQLVTELGSRVENKLVVYATHVDAYERRPFNVLTQKTEALGLRESLNIEWSKWKLQAGLEYFQDQSGWDTYETLDEGHGAMLNQSFMSRRFVNTFLFAEFRPGKRWVADAGLNLNYSNYRYASKDDAFVSSQVPTEKGSFPPVLSPRVGINFNYSGKHYVYASAGHGFSMPTLEESLLPDGAVNTELLPEFGWNMELGSRGKIWSERCSYDLTAYVVYLENLLVTERLAEDIFTGKNAGKVLNKGVEFSGFLALVESADEHAFALDMQFSASVSENKFLDFVDEGEDFSGKYLPGVPATMIYGSLDASFRGIDCSFDHRYVGKQWMNDQNTLQSDNYYLSNVMLSKEQNFAGDKFGLKISVGVKNLWNSRYASMILVNAPSFGGRAPRYYYPGLPRHFSAGIVIHWH